MKGTAKCFLLDERKAYTIEIPYAELQRCREQDEAFQNRRFIALHGMLLEVTEQEYQDFERQRRRERSHRQRWPVFAEGSEALEQIAHDAALDFETQVLDQIMVEKLRNTLSALSTQDYELIEALYFCQKSGAEYGAEIGISKQAVSQRKHQILVKLKNLMEN
jgi:RNA polymerase sigma factor (sigma-70 family)